jgi:cyclophilin family peptidyl-prolyl cis-trans isomerase
VSSHTSSPRWVAGDRYAAHVDQPGDLGPPLDVVEHRPPWRPRWLPPWRPSRSALIFAAGVAVGVLLSSTAWVVVDRLRDAKPVAAPQAIPSVAPAAPGPRCDWRPDPGPDQKPVGTPPASGEPRSGSATITITTSLGVIEITIDRARTPCTAASFAYLASRQFFDGSACHRLTTAGLFVLECGDPTGTGRGGPGYRFADENAPAWPVPPGLPPPQTALPTALPSGLTWLRPGSEPPGRLIPCTDMTIPPELLSPGQQIIIECGGLVPRGQLPTSYPRGTVAMSHGGEPNSNGSRFFVSYRDGSIPPIYMPFGVVTKGMEIIDQVAAGGATTGTDGPPKIRLEIRSLTVH